MPVGKPFLAVTQCCCPRGKSFKSLQVLVQVVFVLVLGPQIIDLVFVLET